MPPDTSAATPAQKGKPPDERTSLAHDRTGLAVTRSYLALERTLMAWTRTSASLISFGFTIYKFFEGRPPRPGTHLLGYRTFSEILIVTGMVALILATLAAPSRYKGTRGRVSRKAAISRHRDSRIDRPPRLVGLRRSPLPSVGHARERLVQVFKSKPHTNHLNAYDERIMDFSETSSATSLAASSTEDIVWTHLLVGIRRKLTHYSASSGG